MDLIFRLFLSASITAFFWSCSNSQGSQDQQKPSLVFSTDPLRALQNFADVFRTSENDPYGLLQDPALTSVTKEFGPSLISMKNLPRLSPQIQADVVPWSSWWYPRRDDLMFTDHSGDVSSPLTKYDWYRQIRNPQARSAADFERQGFNSNSRSWEGLCDAWALASLLHPEPRHAIEANSNRSFPRRVSFEIGDLKALLLKTYEAVSDRGLKYYGQKFTGDLSGWIHPDLFPEQLHRFVEVELMDHKKAFIMDHDPGVEVWNVPVFKANYKIEAVPGNPKAVSVRLWLVSAEPVLPQQQDFVGTKEVIREYNYILEGERNANDELQVTSGYWIQGPTGVDSRRDHPDYLVRIVDPQKIERKSWNPEIDVKVVDEIIQKSWD